MIEIPEKNRRKWQCFVCGVEHTSYEDYRAHIVEKHEEGREYLLCPKCQAPVRDMRLHWKLKHPYMEMPKGLPHRTAVWMDQKGTRRKTQYKQGEHVSTKTGKPIHYRSGLEKKYYELLDQDADVVSYYTEILRVPYYFKGEMKTYLPDLIIQFVDGHKEVWEIKPSSLTTLAMNQAKWTYATKFCEERGIKFSVWTEKVGLGKLEKKIRDQKLNAQGSDSDFFSEDNIDDVLE